MSIVESLRVGRALIADPQKWTQGEFAKDAFGNPVEPNDSEAVCWCAYGALGDEADGAAGNLLFFTAQEHFNRTVVEINDNLGHEEVLRLYDLTIAAAEAEGR